MARFAFTAIDNAGNERQGTVEAPDRKLAATQIKSYGFTPSRIKLVKVKKAGGSNSAGRALGNAGQVVKKPAYFGAASNRKGITTFTRQLATLLHSGLPLLKSLEVLMAQERNLPFKWLVSQLADNIRSGNTLSEGLGQFPREFDRLYVNMVRAGEASGTLDIALSRLALYMEKAMKMKGKLMAAVMYPAVVSVMSVLIVIGLLAFVVPQFEKIFDEQLNGEALPMLTQYVMMASSFVAEQWYIGLGLLLLLYVSNRLFKRTGAGRSSYDFLKLKLPKFGDLFSKIYVSRFSRTLGTLLESGVPVLDALNITRDACGNKIVMDAVDKARNRVKDGETLSAPMAATGVFPPMVTSMVEVGEETGEMPEMLSQVADIYDDEVDNAVVGLTSIVEPLLIVFLAIVIVFIILALFLPFVKIMQGFVS